MRRIFILLLSLLILNPVVQAQDNLALAPIIAVSKGDIYAINPVDGGVKLLTHHPALVDYVHPNMQSDLAISPDGHYLAYLQTPRFYEEAVKKLLIVNPGYSPSNIVLLDLTSGEEKLIAEQPVNVSYRDWSLLWYRSNLVWSPDGGRLAFTQLRGDLGETSFQFHLMIYDGIGTRTFISNEWFGDITWLKEGITAGTTIWDMNGQISAQHNVNKDMSIGHHITYHGVEYVIVDSPYIPAHEGRVYVMNMLTGEYGVVDGILSSVSAVTPENSLVFSKDDNNFAPRYVLDPQTLGRVYIPPVYPPYALNFTFSPDGRHFAYILFKTSVNISDLNGYDLTVDFKPDAILWSAKRYTIANHRGDQSADVEPTTIFLQ